MSIDSGTLTVWKSPSSRREKRLQVENEFLDPAEAQLHRGDPLARFLRPARSSPASAGSFAAISRQEPLDRALMRQDEGERIVDLVRDACNELAEGGHLGRLDELGLRALQELVRLLELAIGIGQRLRRGGFRRARRARARASSRSRSSASMRQFSSCISLRRTRARMRTRITSGSDRRRERCRRRPRRRRVRACRHPPRCRGRRWRRSGPPCRAAGRGRDRRSVGGTARCRRSWG